MASSLLAGLSILIIGDSHMATPNYLIGGLHDDLIRKGANVHSIGICGANASDWLKASPGGACGAAERRGKAPAVILRGKASTTPINPKPSREAVSRVRSRESPPASAPHAW